MARRRLAFLREPLLHFLLIGAGLFALHGWLNETGVLSTKTIVIDRGRIDQLAAGFALLHQRPPTANELDGLVDDAVKEEIFYREALAQGLDRDDVIVRRRMRQKLEFISEDIAPVPEPTDAQLQSWLDAHRAQFSLAPRYTFEQVFLDPARRGASLTGDTDALLARLRGGDVAAVGDALLFARRIDNASADDLRSQFGASFAARLGTLAPGTWQGPVRSGFGVHLVRLLGRDAGRTPTLSDVRADVRADWLHARRDAANAAFYAGLRKRYDVRIEQPEPPSPVAPANAIAGLRP